MAAELPTQTHSPTPLHQLSFVLQHLADELLMGQVGVGLSQVRILGVLSKTTPKSQRHLAVSLGQTEGNVSRHLHNMKGEGLVSITKNRKDSRQRDIMLTTKGANKKAKAEKLLSDQQTELLRLLVGNSEVKEFIRTTERLLVALNVETKRNHKIFGTE